MTGYTWHALNPSLADYGATFGARGPYGMTALELPSGSVVVVGCFTGADRARAESEFDSVRDYLSRGGHTGNLGIDRRISPKTFAAWRMEPRP